MHLLLNPLLLSCYALDMFLENEQECGVVFWMPLVVWCGDVCIQFLKKNPLLRKKIKIQTIIQMKKFGGEEKNTLFLSFNYWNKRVDNCEVILG